MRNWYRAMVVFLTVSAVFCMSAVVYVGFELWYLGESQTTVVDGEHIRWSNGLYEGTGTLKGGALEEMLIRRIRLENRQ